MTLLPPAYEVCEGYVFTGVCLSTMGGHVWLLGGCAWLLWGACVVAPGGHAWLLWRACMVALGGGHTWFLPGGVHGFCWGACMVFARGCAWFLLGGHAWFFPGGHAWFFPGGMHGFSGGHAWFFLGGGGVHRIWRDTVNERAVRILLECILVLSWVSTLGPLNFNPFIGLNGWQTHSIL